MQSKKSAAHFYGLSLLVENLADKCLSWGGEGWCKACDMLFCDPWTVRLLLHLLWSTGD